MSWINDCNTSPQILSYTDHTTENTPYKAGLTESREGLLISVKPYKGIGIYNTQFMFINGGRVNNWIFQRWKTSDSKYSEWIHIFNITE